MQLFIMSLSFLLALNNKPGCTDFKTGQFILSDTVAKTEYLITRNDSIQIEKNVKTGEISTYKVSWLSDCEYQLNILQGPGTLMNFYKERTLNIKILETYSDGYTFEGNITGYKFRYIKTIKRYHTEAGNF